MVNMPSLEYNICSYSSYTRAPQIILLYCDLWTKNFCDIFSPCFSKRHNRFHIDYEVHVIYGSFADKKK